MRTSLKIAPGLVSDDTTFAAAGRWSDGSNCRFVDGLPQVIGGWQRLVSDELQGVCRAALAWRTQTYADNLALGTNEKLYLFAGGALEDITPTTFAPGLVDGGGAGYGVQPYGEGPYGVTTSDDFFPLTWSFANWGDELIANPRGQTLFLWDGAGLAEPLDNAPEKSTCVLVAPNRQVHAFGCTQVDGTFNPMCIRGSDLRDNEEWSPAPDNNSFEVILEGGGRIVAAKLIGDYELVWTTQGLHLGTSTGAPGQPYSYIPVPGAIGLIGANAAVVVGSSSAFYLGVDRQFYRYDLGGSITPIPCPIQSDFVDRIADAQTDKIVASFVSKFQEVWFDYPDNRDGQENSRYIAFSLLSGAWFRGLMARSWRMFGQPNPIAVSPDGRVFNHETGNDADGAPLSAFLESADQFLSEDQVLRVRGMYPDLKNQLGAVSLTVITRYKPQGDEMTKGPFVLAPSQDEIDFMASGRLIRFRLESNSSPSYWRLGRPIIDMVADGTR